MTKQTITIRPESQSDYAAITEVNDRAFGQPDEGRLVEQFRATERFIPGLSLVAERDGHIVGHILFYPIFIQTDTTRFESLALAPMSVLPEYQRQSIGTQLVWDGLKRAESLGFKSVLVVGHAEYYPRFGFKPASQWNIEAPFEVPDNCFLALELVPNALQNVHGVVEYPKEFDEV